MNELEMINLVKDFKIKNEQLKKLKERLEDHVGVINYLTIEIAGTEAALIDLHKQLDKL